MAKGNFDTKDLKTWVEVSAPNLIGNIHAVRKFVGNSVSVLAVIKANAYGHGLQGVAGILIKEKGLLCGVDSLIEAKELKNQGIRQPVLILGYLPGGQLQEAIQKGFHISIHSLEMLKRVAALERKLGKKVFGHVKIETGTNRLGIPLAELSAYGGPWPVIGAYTHCADTENVKSNFYKIQLAAFRQALAIFEARGVGLKYIHVAATSGLMLHPELHFNAVRLGIGLYGVWPSAEVRRRLEKRLKLKPVLSWKTRIAQVKHVNAGETVGYDRTYRVGRNRTIAILPIGYYDGYDRRFSNAGHVVVKGKVAPVIGRVCMNMIMVDITGILAKEGDEALLIGNHPAVTADALAEIAGTINYEIVTRINPLIPRVVVKK